MVMGHSEQQWRWYDMQFHPRLAQNAVNSMQLWRTAMLQIKSDALAAAAELSLSTAPHCRHVIVPPFLPCLGLVEGPCCIPALHASCPLRLRMPCLRMKGGACADLW